MPFATPLRPALAALLLVACTDPADRAAKQRIFSPEDPPASVSAAHEKLAAEQLGSDERLAQRVLAMGAAEATERLGAHRLTAEVTFEWTGGPDKVRLSETRLLEAAAGGVAGDFHARLDNSRDLGLEVLRIHGRVYARSKYGKYRVRLRDRGIAERSREDVAGALREVMALFDGRARLAPQGTASVDGREAYRYELRLGESSGAVRAAAVAPPVAFGRGGVDETTRRRLAFHEKRQPRSLAGEVLVDAATAVVLKAHVDGRLDVPAQEKAPAAQLRITLDTRVQGVGKDPGLKPPADALPDVDKPEGIADALDRFGISRKATDAGTDDTESDDDTAG